MHITADYATNWLANRALDSQQVSDNRKKQILPVTKYNTLVDIFHASTVLLVVAVVSAILFAYTTAFVFGSIALFTRATTLKEFEKYKTPRPAPEPNPPGERQGAVAFAYRILLDHLRDIRLRHALNQSTEDEKVGNIFEKMGFKRPEGWEEHAIFVFDHPIWMNKIPLPNAEGA